MRTPFLLVVAMGSIGFLPAQRFSPPVQMFGYEIVRSFPHDPQAFTQGLVYRDGVLYEGTGMNGRSSIRKVKLETGEVLQIHSVDEQYFGEGITEWKGSLVQLTYTTEIGFVYDLATFKPLKTFQYRGEGWGLTHDGTRLIMSDGSSQLRFIDPDTLKETGRLTVRQAGQPVEQLNELEYVKGEIFANVWMTEHLVRISPGDGRVTGLVDLSGLLTPSERAKTDVLNGIAYDPAGDRLFVTGKNWPKLFQIKLVPRGVSRGGGGSARS
jgi:glutaminyl-peptide cyclotransferase